MIKLLKIFIAILTKLFNLKVTNKPYKFS